MMASLLPLPAEAENGRATGALGNRFTDLVFGIGVHLQQATMIGIRQSADIQLSASVGKKAAYQRRGFLSETPACLSGTPR
eukprot:3367128-Pyramimonas_sp.AAC.1